MANRYSTLIQVVTVAANSTESFSLDISDDMINIYRIVVIPSIIGGSMQLQIYDNNSYDDDNLVYGTQVISGAFFDPVHIDAQSNVTNRGGLRTFLFPYDDENSGNQLHGRIINNDVVQKDFTLTFIYEEK